MRHEGMWWFHAAKVVRRIRRDGGWRPRTNWEMKAALHMIANELKAVQRQRE
jgi:hypothetical protein